MKFLNKYNKFFEAKRVNWTEKSDYDAFWDRYKRDDVWVYFFQNYMTDRIANLDDTEENDTLSDISSAQRMTDLMSLSDRNKNKYTTDLAEIRRFRQDKKTGNSGQVKDRIWKVKKSDNPGELATISFNDDGYNHLLSCNFIIYVMLMETPPVDLFKYLYETDYTPENDKKLSEWLYNNSNYIVTTGGDYITGTKDAPGWDESMAPMIEEFTEEVPNTKLRYLGSSKGFNTLGEALRQIWLWLIAKNLKTIDYDPDKKLKIYKSLISDSSKIEGQEWNLETIIKGNVLHPTQKTGSGYFAKIIDVVEILQSIYGVLGLKIEYGVQYDSEKNKYGTRIDTSLEMVKWITVSNDLHSVPNSFLDIVTSAVYQNNTCLLGKTTIKKKEYKTVDNLGKPDVINDVNAFVIKLQDVIRNDAKFKKYIEFTGSPIYEISPIDRETAIKDILNAISKYFNSANKLIVNGAEVDDIFKLGELIENYTNLVKNNFDANLNNIQLYKLLYSYLTPVKDDSPIVLYEADGTKRANGLVFKDKIKESIKNNSISPLGDKFKELDSTSATSLSKAAKRGHRISDENPEDMLGYNPNTKK